LKIPNDPWPAGAPPAPQYCGEPERSRVLAGYGLDSLHDDGELDAIVRFAARLCETPIALVSVIEEERQRFLARQGVTLDETPRDVSFCAHAMLLAGGMVIEDARADDRFADNPLVTGAPHVRFYAGHPLVSEEGAPLGTLCVIDSEPRPGGLNELQREGMAVLALAVMRRMRAQRAGLSAARMLEQSDARLKALADSIPDIAWSAGPDGKPNYFNRRWSEFTGAPLDDMSKIGADFFHPDDYRPMIEAWQQSVSDGEPFECEGRLRRFDGEYRWVLTRAVPMFGADGKVTQWFGTITDIDETRRLSESRDLLARELSHRIKNIFAVIAGLVSLSARAKPEHKPFADQLTQTIRALGRAHDFVRPSGSAQRDALQGLLHELFTPYDNADGPRVRVSGDDCAIASRAATPLALVFHELATNSAKYGALSTDDGHIDLTINDAGDRLLLCWTEHGGSAPDEAPQEGFGSRLVEMSISGQLGGWWERRFEPEGLVVEMAMSKEAVAR
jgi:PAS domain S-box-containing protein